MDIYHRIIARADRSSKHRFCWMLVPLVCLLMFGSHTEAMTISDYGSYTILAGVHEDNAETVHAAMSLFGGLTPIQIDAFADGATVYYSSIWKKSDGIYREIFLRSQPYEVRNRLDSKQKANKLWHVDAWTRNEGSLEYSADYLPAWYFETYCCGIWTDESLPERKFVYLPLAENPNNLYWDEGTPTIHEKHAALLEQGYELQSACKVRPDWPIPIPQDLGPPAIGEISEAEEGQLGYYETSSIVALYEKNAAPSSGLFELMNLDEAQDYVDDETLDGYKPVQIEPYQGHPMGAEWDSVPDAWAIRFGVVTRKDDRVHEIAWGFEEKDIDWAHHLMYSGGMKPISITASRWHGVSANEWRYTLIFREKEIRVKDSHDPSRDLKPDSRFDPDDPSTW